MVLAAQESLKWNASFQFGADLMSRYIWRGINFGGNGPAIQPTLKFNVGNNHHLFTLGAWGSYSVCNTSSEECDLFLSYTFRDILSLMVTDYFFPGAYTGERDQYFCYSQDSTGHVFEGAILFNGTRKIPLTFLAALNFYGNDAHRMKKINDTTFVENGLQYSTYIELGFKAVIKGIDFNAFIGGTLTSPDTDRHETGYYLNSTAGITNIGIKVSKSIPVTEKYSIPVQASLITNPMLGKIYLIFGLSF
jgi:hypothetical protein